MLFNNIIALTTNISTFDYMDDAITGLMIYVIILNIFNRKLKVKKNVFLFLSFSIIVLLLSIIVKAPIRNIILGYVFSFKPFIYGLYFYSLNLNKLEVNYLFKYLEKIALIVLIGAVLDILFFPQFRYLLNNTIKIDKTLFGINPVQSLFTHPNVYSFFMGFWSIYYFTKYLIEEKRKKYNFIFFIIYFMGCILSLRRKTIIGIGLIIIYVIIFNFKVKDNRKMLSFDKKILILTVLIGLTLLNLNNISLFIDEYFGSKLGQANTYNSRYLLMEKGSKIAIDYFPFGSGLGTFGGYASSIYYSEIYEKYGMSSIYGFSRLAPQYTGDNYFGHIIGEFGILGSIICIIIFIKCIVKLRLYFKKDNYYIVLFSIFILLASIPELFGIALYEISATSILIFSTVGIALSIVDRSEK